MWGPYKEVGCSSEVTAKRGSAVLPSPEISIENSILISEPCTSFSRVNLAPIFLKLFQE